MHRVSHEERSYFFLSAREWAGTVSNRESDKCSELRWCALDAPPREHDPPTFERPWRTSAGVCGLQNLGGTRPVRYNATQAMFTCAVSILRTLGLQHRISR